MNCCCCCCCANCCCCCRGALNPPPPPPPIGDDADDVVEKLKFMWCCAVLSIAFLLSFCCYSFVQSESNRIKAAARPSVELYLLSLSVEKSTNAKAYGGDRSSSSSSERRGGERGRGTEQEAKKKKGIAVVDLSIFSLRFLLCCTFRHACYLHCTIRRVC